MWAHVVPPSGEVREVDYPVASHQRHAGGLWYPPTGLSNVAIGPVEERPYIPAAKAAQIPKAQAGLISR